MRGGVDMQYSGCRRKDDVWWSLERGGEGQVGLGSEMNGLWLELWTCSIVDLWPLPDLVSFF